MDSGPYEVEFKGEQHCLRVPAVLLNSCVIQAHAPGTVKCLSQGVVYWLSFGQTLYQITLYKTSSYKASFYLFLDLTRHLKNVQSFSLFVGPQKLQRLLH